jgi:transcriptional regulator with XRE-family HTH domain/tetratricopeptide (TPR) repeat protein
MKFSAWLTPMRAPQSRPRVSAIGPKWSVIGCDACAHMARCFRMVVAEMSMTVWAGTGPSNVSQGRYVRITTLGHPRCGLGRPHITAGNPAFLLVIRGGAATLGGVMATKPSSPLARARQAAGYTQERFAEELGVDRSTVGRWERGVQAPLPWQRPDIATALKITLGQLDGLLPVEVAADLRATCSSSRLGYRSSGATRYPVASISQVDDVLTHLPEPEGGSARQTSPAIVELCGVLTDYGFGPGRFCSVQHDEVPSLGDLERDLRVTFNAYQQSRFTSAASGASALVADAQLATREYQGSDRTKSFGLLALSYQAAASVLTKVGESNLALVAAERGLNAARAASSPTVQGSLIRSVAFALLSTGRLEPAMRLIESGADYIRADVVGDDAGLSVYGMLFLAGAMAAARFGDNRRTADYLQEANDAAERLGKDANHLWTAFGPTNVAIHRINTAVELGDMQTALDCGLSLNTDSVPAERRVRYLLDVARVYSVTGNPDDALGTLLIAERIAPEQVRQHHLTKKVVLTLVRNAAGKPTAALDKLTKRVNVHGSI